MSNRDLIKTFTAEGTITPSRIAKCGANDYGLLQAAASTDKTIGVVMPLGSLNQGLTYASGDTVEVMLDGVADLQIGGTVTRGDLLISDANGCGITATGTAGTNYRIIGIALVSGVANDIIPVLLTPGSFQA